MKNEAMTKTTAKKTRSISAYSIVISRGERKRLAAMRRTNTPVNTMGAYFQLRYTVRNMGMRYRIQIITPRGVPMSMANMSTVAIVIYATIRRKSSPRLTGHVSFPVSAIQDPVSWLYKKLVNTYRIVFTA